MSSRLLARTKATISGWTYHDIYKTRVALELAMENCGCHLVEYSGSDVLCWQEHAGREMIRQKSTRNRISKLTILLLFNFPKENINEKGKSGDGRAKERERAANTDEVSL